MGSFPDTFSVGGASAGLIRDPSGSSTSAVIDGAIAGTVSSEQTPEAPSDPSFSNVRLLLHGDGTPGGQNNSFIDSSSNGLLPTRYGNVTQ